MFTLAIDTHRAQLEKVFERRAVAQLSELRRTLGVRSRTTVFFTLKAAGYCTSYSHAGRYYTLRRIPQFDANGLWSAGDVRFSEHGTLRATVVVLVSEAPAGHTHEELEVILGLRVHDTLRSLVQAHALGREQVGPVYVYLHPQAEHAAAQVEQRRRMLTPPKPGPQPAQGASPIVDAPRIIEVLVAVIHAPKADAHAIAARLRAAGSSVTDELVEAVFARYELGKKTAPSRSPRSRR
jgi:hypothetical protein